MQHKTLALIGIVVAVVAIAAIAFGPAGLLTSSSPGTNPNDPGSGGNPGPHPNALDAPTWHEGDSWTYLADASSGDVSRDGSSLSGTLTRTVVSADSSMYNVSVQGSFRARWVLNPIPGDGSAGTIALEYRTLFDDATVDGYTWVRASDLAILKEVHTVHFEGTFEMDAHVYNASYTATVETTYEPALNLWAFPVEPNEMWEAASTASVHASTDWKIDGPQSPWEFGGEFNATREIRLFLVSGEPEDIETPAGTFTSIPVRIGLPVLGRSNVMDLADVAAGLDHEIPVPRDRAVETWFSETAKNVVRVSFLFGGFQANLVLSAYHLG